MNFNRGLLQYRENEIFSISSMVSMIVLKPLDIIIHDLYYILRALSVVPKKHVFYVK